MHSRYRSDPPAVLLVVKWKVAAIISSTLLAIVLLVGLLFSAWRLGTQGSLRSLDAPAVVTQIKALRQLVTVRYSIQRVVGLTEPKVPVGSESILLMVEGEAQAGIDLAALLPADVRLDGKRAVIHLPPPKLFNVFLDEKKIKVWDRQVTWWTPWVPFDPELEHKARLRAVSDVRTAALTMGILEQSETNAETAIRELLRAFHLEAEFPRQNM